MQAVDFFFHQSIISGFNVNKLAVILYMRSYYYTILLQPDSEDTNEMVFCDGCDICVHQVSSV